MSKPLHPEGIHELELIDVLDQSRSRVEALGVFQGVGSNKGCYTLIRKLSQQPKWFTSTGEFFNQIGAIDPEKPMAPQVAKYIGEKFLCDIGPGRGSQKNIKAFLPVSNINSTSHVSYEALTGESHVG